MTPARHLAPWLAPVALALGLGACQSAAGLGAAASAGAVAAVLRNPGPASQAALRQALQALLHSSPTLADDAFVHSSFIVLEQSTRRLPPGAGPIAGRDLRLPAQIPQVHLLLAQEQCWLQLHSAQEQRRVALGSGTALCRPAAAA